LTDRCRAGPYEKRLLIDLLHNYNTLERPVAKESDPVVVQFGLTLQQIIDVDEKNQILTTNAWLNFVSLPLRFTVKDKGHLTRPIFFVYYGLKASQTKIFEDCFHQTGGLL
jgi:hypothetical protein